MPTDDIGMTTINNT